MLEEIGELVKIIAGLPHLAIWALCGYLIYKLAVIGSVYGVIRMAIDKAHSVLTQPKIVESKVKFRNLTIISEEAVERLMIKVIDRPSNRIKSPGWFSSFEVEWLESAIREKIERETDAASK